MHEVTGDAKPVLGLVLVGDNIVGEILSFQSFALKSGLYQEMRITGVEFLSWNSLEATLAETSVQKFEAAFSNKWISGSPSKLADIMTFDLERDSPAHHYEYLDDVEKHIFDGIGEN